MRRRHRARRRSRMLLALEKHEKRRIVSVRERFPRGVGKRLEVAVLCHPERRRAAPESKIPCGVSSTAPAPNRPAATPSPTPAPEYARGSMLEQPLHRAAARAVVGEQQRDGGRATQQRIQRERQQRWIERCHVVGERRQAVARMGTSRGNTMRWRRSGSRAS